MFKVINGRRYNTDSATEMARVEEYDRTDRRWYCDTLYRKMNGEFFLFGMGDSESKYSKTISDGIKVGGFNFIPMTFYEARDWSKDNLGSEKFKEIFGLFESDKGLDKRTVTYRLSLNTLDKIARLADESRLTKSEIIEKAIDFYFKKD